MVEAELEEVVVSRECVSNPFATEVPDEVLTQIEFLQSLLALPERAGYGDHCLVSKIVSEQVEVLHALVSSKAFSERDAEGVSQMAILQRQGSEGVVVGDDLANRVELVLTAEVVMISDQL